MPEAEMAGVRPGRRIRTVVRVPAYASLVLVLLGGIPVEAQDAPRSRVEAIAALRRARTAVQVGNLAEAARLIQGAGEFAKLADDRLVAAWTHQLNGESSAGKGDRPAALTAFTAAYEGFQALNDAVGTAGSRANLGRLLVADGKPQEAVAHLEAALEGYEKLKQTTEMATTLADLAAAQQARGAYDAAEASLRKALALHRAAPDRQPQFGPELLAALGRCLVRQGKHAEAIAPLKEGAELAKTLAAGETEAEARAGLGIAYQRIGELDRAFEEYRAALALVAGATTGTGEADLRNNLGALEQERGRPQEAAVELTKAVDLYTRAKNDAGTARAWCNQAMVQESLGKNSEAIAAYEKALAIRRNQKDSAGCVAVLDGLALLYAAQNDVAKAREYQTEADTLRRTR